MNNKQVAQGAGVSKQVDELATISVEALFQRLSTTKAGLSEEEAERRLDQYGPNEVAEEKARTWVHRLFTASRNPLVILLTVLATISYATGDGRAGTVMLLMVSLALGLRFVQETRADTDGLQYSRIIEKAEQSIAALREPVHMLHGTLAGLPFDLPCDLMIAGLAKDRDAAKAEVERLRVVASIPVTAEPKECGCREALERYADPKNWARGRIDGPIDRWDSCEADSWNGPDLARAALERL